MKLTRRERERGEEYGFTGNAVGLAFSGFKRRGKNDRWMVSSTKLIRLWNKCEAARAWDFVADKLQNREQNAAALVLGMMRLRN